MSKFNEYLEAVSKKDLDDLLSETPIGTSGNIDKKLKEYMKYEVSHGDILDWALDADPTVADKNLSKEEMIDIVIKNMSKKERREFIKHNE